MVRLNTWSVATISLSVVALALMACSPKTANITPLTTSAGPGGGLVVQSDSIITGKVVAVRSSSSGYPWQIDVLVQSSQNVGALPNPTKDKIGQTVTFQTEENVGSLQAGQAITAHAKYVGDVPRPGIVLYLFSIKPG